MSPPRRSSSFSASPPSSPSEATPESGPAESGPAEPEPSASPFLEALASLLEERGLEVPPGLREAPPEAYAGQRAEVVTMMARFKDADLAARAAKVAGWQQRQNERNARAWDASPLIAELRRRGLPEPSRPARVAIVVFSMKKPLAQWSDAELLEAVAEWARR